MRVLVAMQRFQQVGGTETYVLTVAEQLQRLGHQVHIYAHLHGDMAMLARSRAVDVVSELDDAGPVDVVLSQDAVMAYELADRAPGVPQVFVSHSATFDPQLPPLVAGVAEVVVVMSERFRERLEALDTQLRIVRLRQPIDTERLIPRSSPHAVPRRALLLGNYLTGDARRLLVDTWTERGVEVVQVGMVSRATLQPEDDIAAADIVVGKARAVLDAMSCGRPAYIYDAFGSDGWVTAENYDAIEADGIAGQAFPGVASPERLREDLASYDPAMGLVNRTLILKHHQARAHVHELVRLFTEVAPRAADAAPPTEARELGRQMRLRWRAEEELVGLRVAFGARQQQHDEALARVEEALVRAEEALVRAETSALAAQQHVDHLQKQLDDAESTVRHHQEMLASERAIRSAAERRRSRAQERRRRLAARHEALVRAPWVRLGRALHLVPRPPGSTR